MNFKYLFLGLFALVLLSSCNKRGDFEMNIKATMQGETLVMNEAFNLGEIDVKFENLTFYITDVSLVNAEGETLELSDAEFVDLKAFDEPTASLGQVVSFKDLPVGTYNKINWKMGVASDLNAMTPSDFDVSDALGRSDHYWEAWGSYIFSKTEGSADVTGDGVFDLKFFYHTGSDPLMRSFTLEEDIVISEGETKSVEFFLDYDKMLQNADGTYFDIEAFPRNHDPNELEIVTQYVDNYVKALTIRK